MRLAAYERNMIAVISACVMLHNVCEEEGLTSILDKLPQPPVPLPQVADIAELATFLLEGEH